MRLLKYVRCTCVCVCVCMVMCLCIANVRPHLARIQSRRRKKALEQRTETGMQQTYLMNSNCISHTLSGTLAKHLYYFVGTKPYKMHTPMQKRNRQCIQYPYINMNYSSILLQNSGGSDACCSGDQQKMNNKKKKRQKPRSSFVLFAVVCSNNSCLLSSIWDLDAHECGHNIHIHTRNKTIDLINARTWQSN